MSNTSIVSSNVAALASLLFAGLALFASKYYTVSLLYLLLLPIAYFLPADFLKTVTAICFLQCLVFGIFVMLPACHVKHLRHMEPDDRLGILATTSIGLVADASFHRKGAASAEHEFRRVYALFGPSPNDSH